MLLRRFIGIFAGLAMVGTLVWLIVYRDTMQSPRLQAADFAGLDRQAGLFKLAKATVEGGAPGVVISWLQGNVSITKSAGIANKTTGASMPPDHPLRVASISKLYTAAVIHGLIGEDRLTLDQKIIEILPSDVMEGLHNGGEITVRHLLLHTSGIADDEDARHYLLSDWKHEALTLARTLPVSKRGKSTGMAGERFEYSNMGDILLGAIAEEVSGEALGDLIAHFITEPLGHTHTTYNVKYPVSSSIHGYGTKFRPWADTWAYWQHSGPDAGVMAPADEIAEVFEALFLKSGKLSHIGQAMLAEEVPRYSEGRYQALGPHVLVGSKGLRVIGHSGDVFGYQTAAYAVPARGFVFVGHVNCDCDVLSGSMLANIIQLEEAMSGQGGE